MRLKVISDGTALGTKVTNADTGQLVEKVRSISIYMIVGERPRCNIMIEGIEIDIIGDFQMEKE